MAGHPISALEALLGPIVNREDDGCPPMQAPVLHTDDGTAFVPHAFDFARSVELPLARGVGLAWAPCPPIDGALLIMAGGNLAEPTDDAIAITLSRAGIRALIRSLQSIECQLEAMP